MSIIVVPDDFPSVVNGTEIEQKLNEKLAEKWMTKLSKHQIDVVENISSKLLTQLDYPLIGKKITVGFLEKLYYKLHQAIIGEFQIQYRWRKFRLKEAFKK